LGRSFPGKKRGKGFKKKAEANGNRERLQEETGWSRRKGASFVGVRLGKKIRGKEF